MIFIYCLKAVDKEVLGVGDLILRSIMSFLFDMG